LRALKAYPLEKKKNLVPNRKAFGNTFYYFLLWENWYTSKHDGHM